MIGVEGEKSTASSERPSWLSGLIRDHIVWILGLIPFVLAAFSVLFTSAGDPQIFGYIIQNLNVVSLFLTVTLPLIPVSLVFISLYYLARSIQTPKDKRDSFSFERNILAVAVILLGALMMPLIAVYFFTGVFFTLISQAVTARCRNEKFTVLAANLRNLFLGLSVVGGTLIVTFSWNWLPTEALDVKGQPITSGQVLSSDGEWTKFLEDSRARRTVHIVRTSDIKSRTPCNARQGSQYNSVINFFVKNRKSGPQIDCPS
ncbi:hypothetical protein [Mycolicibacterium mengxianglii]|uniref:hypothetical protein n=1 Tax=Mycolicibacterium mengxianglii TaxID=2736649 RepID=UPI0018EF1F8A|nr:hypothetical protein [Mycolicibacterium mengxianglii]